MRKKVPPLCVVLTVENLKENLKEWEVKEWVGFPPKQDKWKDMFNHDKKFSRILKQWGKGVKENWGREAGTINIHVTLTTSYKIKVTW